MNRKVINATPTTIDGIKFRSKLEAKCYTMLKKAGFDPQYEFMKFNLLECAITERVWYRHHKRGQPPLFQEECVKPRNITYTPDFIVLEEDNVFILEVKGHENDTFYIKKALFISNMNRYFPDSKVWYFILKSEAEIKKCIKLMRDGQL